MAAVWAGLVLCATLGMTWLTWRRSEAAEALKLQTYFDYRVRDAEARITQRMMANEQVLRGVGSLFLASAQIDRTEFRDYVAALQLEEHYPGIQAVGFMRLFPAVELERQVGQLQEVLPGATVHPPGPRESYTAVVFIEPFAGLNLRAVGFDASAEPVLRAALDRSRDEGREVLSGKVRLVQERADSPGQAGAVMYLPVFGKGSVPQRVEERRARLRGWVFMSFRMDDLMDGTLGERGDELATRLYDGVAPTPEGVLYDSSAGKPFDDDERYQAQHPLLLSGHPWTMLIRTRPQFGAHLGRGASSSIALSGICLSLLLTALVWVLIGGKDRAERVAREMNRHLLKANADLQESELRLRLALRGGELGLWDWDIPSGRVIFNERWAEMLGFTLAELEPRVSTWEGLLHPDEAAGVKASLDAHLRGEVAAFSMEYRFRHKDGHWVWILDSGVVVQRAPDGQPLRAAGTHLDISERKQAEEERKELLARSARAERSAALGTLAAGMAHEINNPLTVVLSGVGFAQTQLQGLGQDSLRDVHEALADASEGTLRVRDLVADLQSFASGNHAEDAQCELASALERAARVSRHAHTKVTTLITELPELPPVCGSEAELVQLFGCLLVNAAQAGGLEPNTVRVSAEVRGPVVAVTISDTGAGIPAEILPRIFDPFFTTRRPGRGKGLGLPVAQGIARGLGGSIEVRSEPGRGTTATVLLPVAPPV